VRYVQLRAFHHVAIHGGFSRAANALSLTQPAVSDQVRKLEETYGVVLFDRQKKQVTMTPAGRRLLELTRRMFDNEQQVLELLEESRTPRSGALRINVDAACHLSPLLSRFREKFPDVRISVKTGNTEAVIASLYANQADLGIVGEIPRRQDLEIVRLSSSPIIGFVAASHPLAGPGKASLRKLAAYPLVLRERGSKIRQKLEETALALGVTLHPAIEAEGREAVHEIVAAGVCVGFVSSAEFRRDPRVAPLRIEGAEMIMDEALACLRERGGAKLVRSFLEIASSLSERETLRQAVG
jgi:aminoethylphosphonate catabolism LysR family transcriptional regulator